MVSPRSRFEIYVNILTVIRSGTVLPTKIMYGAYLSWSTLVKALESLIDQGLIEVQKIEGNTRSNKKYLLTRKGNNVLNFFNDIKELIEPEKTVTILSRR